MRCCATNNPGVHHLNFNTVADRREQRERSRRISDSFAPAKPVPILRIGVLERWVLFFSEFPTQDTSKNYKLRVSPRLESMWSRASTRRGLDFQNYTKLRAARE